MSTVVDGHVPNYVDPETRVPLLLGVQISFTAIALIIVLLRLYTRKFIRHVLTAEDWIATASLVLGVASTISSCLGVLGGTGLHYYDVPPGTDESVAALTSFIVQVLYQPTIQLARISILLFYLNSLGKQARPVCLGLVGISILFAIVCTVVEFLQCTPTSMLWTGHRPAGYQCIKQSLFFCVTGLINLVIEIILILVPIPVIWKLGLPTRTKLALCSIFSVGFITVAAQIARLVIWFASAFNDGNRQSSDASWNRVPMVNWSCIEYTTAIMCASLPHLKALVSQILPGYFDSAVRSLVSKRRSVAYKSGPLSPDPNEPSPFPDRRSIPHSFRYSARVSMSRASSRMPIMGHKIAAHDVDGHSQEVMLESIQCKDLESGNGLGAQAEARNRSNRGSTVSDNTQHKENWPL